MKAFLTCKTTGTKITQSKRFSFRQSTKVKNLVAHSDFLTRENQQLKSDLSLVSNQKKYIDAMKQEVRQMADNFV